MSSRLLNDLTAWESGELDLTAVESRNPGVDVSGLVELHNLMVAAGSHEVPAPAESWQRLKEALPERGVASAPGRLRTSGRWVRRPVLVATTSLLLGGSALAFTSEPVRDGVEIALRKVASLVNLDLGDSGEQGLDSGGKEDTAATTGPRPGRTQPGAQRGSDGNHGHSGEKGGEEKGQGVSKMQGPENRPPNNRGAPGSVPGVPGNNGPKTNKPPTDGKDGSKGKPDTAGKPEKPDTAGKPEGAGKSGDAGTPQGPEQPGGKDKGKSQDKGPPDEGETTGESGIGSPGGNGGGAGAGGGENAGGNGNSGGNGNGGGAGGN